MIRFSEGVKKQTYTNKNTRCILKSHQGVNQYITIRKVPYGRKDRAAAQEIKKGEIK